ncbi:hypothetical protein KUTeg_008751, partial [Tegillarca granosa]
WNDVGFRNPDIKSPNIDKLAREGVILDQSYVQPICTPRFISLFFKHVQNYPLKARSHGVILPQQAACAPLNFTYLPQQLKQLGYATHIVGKWHLGMCKWECTPTYRGFDTFYGFYNGAEDYYNHTISSELFYAHVNGIDFRNNKDPIRSNDTYSTYLYTLRANQVITQHDQTKPLFLYLPFQSVHQPIQVPKVYEDMYKNIENKGRRQFSGMVTAMDDAIGNVINTLKKTGMYNETLIIFTSDVSAKHYHNSLKLNGGWPKYFGNNYPLRGSKTTIYEGGTRAAAFIHGTMLKKTGYTYSGMMHAVDWMPTIVSAAGGTPVPGIDGLNQWPSLLNGSESKRSEFIYNLDDLPPPFCVGHAAIRSGDYKLIQGFPGPYPGWYKPPQYDGEDVVEDKRFNRTYGDYQLFNLKDDPNEHEDLSLKKGDILKQLLAKMNKYREDMVAANFPNLDPKSSPTNYNGFWSPGWC